MRDLFELTEIAYNSLKYDKPVDTIVINKIKDTVLSQGYIGIAQIDTIAGDLEYNAKKIAKYIKFADSVELEAVIFPEFALNGYPIGDVTKRHNIMLSETKKWLSALAELTKKTIAIVGFMEQSSDSSKYFSSVAILRYGVVQQIIRKSAISYKSACCDINYQIPYKEQINEPLYCGYGITVGDEIYNNNLYGYNILDNLLHKQARLLINCSANTYKYNRQMLINNSYSYLATTYGKPFLFVNHSGANDNIIFDGMSQVYDAKGNLIARAKYAEEQFMIVNPYQGIGKIYPLPSGLSDMLSDNADFSLNYEPDLERVYKSLVLGVNDYFSKCGMKRAVLGLSGGLDSSVCAVILADALGKENVFGVSMPSHITSNESKSDAEMLANNLGINFVEAPIRSMIDTTTENLNSLFIEVQKKWNVRYKKSFTPDNIQARSRAMFLWGVSNEFESCIPIATSDKSEAYMGYATINGDMSGGFAPIADITKTKLFALARWINKNRTVKDVIPESVINKRPGAELAIDPLTGKPLIAEDALMPYEFLDEVIWRIENKHQGYNDLLNANFVYEKNNNVPKVQKIEWLDKFYRRMSTALYKWSIMPPFVMVEPHSINKLDYYQPITTSHINYKGVSKDYISSVLM